MNRCRNWLVTKFFESLRPAIININEINWVKKDESGMAIICAGGFVNKVTDTYEDVLKALDIWEDK